MHTFFAILLFAHVFSASTSEQAAVGLDEEAPAAPASLIDLCEAHPVDYAAIHAEIRSGHPIIKDVINCIKVFCKQNNLRGLEAVHADPGSMDSYYFYLHHGLTFASMFGNVDTIAFYATREEVTSDDFRRYAKHAAKAGNLDAVRWFLSDPKFPHDDETSGFSIFLDAVENGHMEVVRWILNEYMTLSRNELAVAASRAHAESHWDIIDILIQHGLDINDDTLWNSMPRIRNAYHAWKARHVTSVEAAEGHLPKELAGIAADLVG